MQQCKNPYVNKVLSFTTWVRYRPGLLHYHKGHVFAPGLTKSLDRVPNASGALPPSPLRDNIYFVITQDPFVLQGPFPKQVSFVYQGPIYRMFVRLEWPIPMQLPRQHTGPPFHQQLPLYKQRPPLSIKF